MIEVRGLKKTFRIPRQRGSAKQKSQDSRQEGSLFHAVKDVSFRCESGMIMGLLGPNGAGKTTTLRILSTALQPSAGQIIIDGQDLSRHPEDIRRGLGFLSGSTGLYPRLTAREMVIYFGKLHGLRGKRLEGRVDELFERFDMHHYANERNDRLSTGMRQRVNIARTIVHDPAVLVLDEPTTGLDLMSSQTILDFIKECKEAKKTVVFSTHHLHEIEAICDEVAVIVEGVSCFNGSHRKLCQEEGVEDLASAFLQRVNSGGRGKGEGRK